MPDLIKLTIDGREVKAPAGTLVIDAAKTAGTEIPAFCYYEGLTLQAACRMCLVEVEKMPKLMTACTLPVAEGMIVRTETPQVAQARKYMLEFLLTNHPLDCPVCDKGIGHGRDHADVEPAVGQTVVQLGRRPGHQRRRRRHHAAVHRAVDRVAVDVPDPPQAHHVKVRTVWYSESRSTGSFPASRISLTRSS